MRSVLTFCFLAALAMPSYAVAQTYNNSSPETLRAVEQFKTKGALQAFLSEKYHVALSESWPKNFPLPVYNSNVVRKGFSHSTKGKPSAGATLVTTDQPRQVFDFYEAACRRANWKVKVPSAKALAELGKTGEMYVLSAEQNKQSIYLTCRKHRESNGTFVSINWTKN